MIIQIDTSKFAPVRVQDKNGDWWVVKGKCKRCGECGCIKSGCIYFTHEVVDDKKLGKCKRQFEKPFKCVMFPDDPLKPLPPKCGFWFEKE